MSGKVIQTKWTRYHEGKLRFFGPKDSVPVMVETYRYLKLQLDLASSNALTEYKRENPYETIHGKTYRNSWLLGAVNRLHARLSAAYSRQVADAGAGNALMVVNNRVDDLVKQVLGKTTKTHQRSRYNTVAYRHGNAAGERMDLGQSKVGKGRLALHA
jgi:hypothetical protein